jgi:hypothetical protein
VQDTSKIHFYAMPEENFVEDHSQSRFGVILEMGLDLGYVPDQPGLDRNDDPAVRQNVLSDLSFDSVSWLELPGIQRVSEFGQNVEGRLGGGGGLPSMRSSAGRGLLSEANRQLCSPAISGYERHGSDD